MRRLIWSCAALAVAAAAWLYLAATYVYNYPNSYFAQCAALVYEVGSDVNPVYRLSRVMAHRINETMDYVLESQGYVRARKVVAPPTPVCEPVVPSLEAIAAADGYNLIQLETPPVANPEPLYPTSEPAPYPGATEESTSGVTTISVPPSAPQDDSDNAPPTMPPVADGNSDEEPPATMPYVEDDGDAEGQAVIQFWKSMFQEKANAESKDSKGNADKSPKGSNEESETPDSQSSEYQMPASHYSSNPSCAGYPHTVTCPYTGKTYPADPKDDPVVPTTSKPKKKKKKDDAGNEPSKMSKILEMEKGTEETPIHPEVDTTEYRKSDAKKGEFDPMPED
jgi:hypothetical protein